MGRKGQEKQETSIDRIFSLPILSSLLRKNYGGQAINPTNPDSDNEGALTIGDSRHDKRDSCLLSKSHLEGHRQGGTDKSSKEIPVLIAIGITACLSGKAKIPRK